MDKDHGQEYRQLDAKDQKFKDHKVAIKKPMRGIMVFNHRIMVAGHNIMVLTSTKFTL